MGVGSRPGDGDGDGEDAGDETTGDGAVDGDDGVEAALNKELDGATTGLPDLDAEGHAAVMASSLLEYYCLNRAADILNEQPGSHGRYTRESREAHFLGRRLYAYKSRFLSSYGVLTEGIEGEDWEHARQYYRDSLDVLGSAALDGLDLNAKRGTASSRGTLEDAPQPAAAAAAAAPTARRALDVWNPLLHMQSGQQGQHGMGTGPAPAPAQGRPKLQRRITDRPDAETGLADKQAAPTFMDLIQNPPLPIAPQPISLPTLAPQTYTQQLGLSRYAAEFEEENMVGKGAYGAVYKVKHHVDGQAYAVKKIPLSARRLKQLQGGGMQELDRILKEVRTLARLEHQNVVRYFGAWAEYASGGGASATHVSSDIPAAVNTVNKAMGPAATQPAMGGPAGLLSQLSESNEEDLSFSVVFEDSTHGAVLEASDHGIVFEEPSSNIMADKDPPCNTSSVRSSSAKSPSGPENDASQQSEDGEDDADEDVESISRRFSFQSPAPTSSAPDDDIFTDGTRGDGPMNQVGRHIAGGGVGNHVPAITLHIQMSLHPLNLAKYLAPKSNGPDPTTTDQQRHCFHVLPSLKILLGVLAGVEYLHAKGIIHRDLKPANIFLATTSSAVDGATSCPACDDEGFTRACHMVPRIGDFGLVADTSPVEGNTASEPVTTRPVGTEFYRPPTVPYQQHINDEAAASDRRRTATTSPADIPRVDECLDVFALGVILFELLYGLDTRMERQMVLSDLTCSARSKLRSSQPSPSLPADFARKVKPSVGAGDETAAAAEVAEQLGECILGMVEPDSGRRWTCKDVRCCLEVVCAMIHDGESGSCGMAG